MKQMIIRVSQDKDNIEILTKDENKREYFKEIEISKLIKELRKYTKKTDGFRQRPIVCDDEIIGLSSNCIVIRQEGRKRDVAFEGKVYSVNFPNSIYIIDLNENSIKSIEAYCYIKFKGINTRIYEYAMPNMLTMNRICMGNAPRNIENNDYILALEKVIYTSYSHQTFSGLIGFKETNKYFEFLEKNPFPYDLLMSLNKSLKNVV